MPLKCSLGSQLLFANSAMKLLCIRIAGASLLMLPYSFEVLEGLLSTKLAHMLFGAMNWKILIEPTLGSENFLALTTWEPFGIGIM